MKKVVSTFYCLLFMAITQSVAQREPICLHPDNPHYFKYNDRPQILVTSGEHYGAVLNVDFNFVKYLDELSAHGLNLTRVFTGAYVEPTGAFNIAMNTLAPAANRYVAPWRRSSQPGFKGGGNKFDLTGWDEQYFNRLKQFISEAEKRNIIVELTLFCPFYEMKQWLLSPMHPANNINNTPDIGKDSVYTLDHSGALLKFQEQLVLKVVTETNAFSNVILEICNEPYFGGVTLDWQRHISALIKGTEQSLPFKHLISQNIANDSELIMDPDPNVSVFNFHYATPPVAVTQNYHLGKVIGDNETGFKGQADSTYRKEGWEFILAGGSLYNNLDYSFAVGYEDGSCRYPSKQPGGGTRTLRTQLSHLVKFMSDLNYIAMSPDNKFEITAQGTSRMHLLSQRGQQYAGYILHGSRATVTLKLPAGTYEVSWLDPVSGKAGSQKTIHQKQTGDVTLKSPDYEFDIAFSIIRRS